MQQYQYESLNADLDEIRLVELMPGSFGDDVRLRIYNTLLVAPIVKRPDERIPLQELQETLPDDWIVRKTLDDRYMFCPGKYLSLSCRLLLLPSQPGTSDLCTFANLNNSNIGNDRLRSWYHPDPGFDHSLYNIQERGEVLKYMTIYEALSYTWGNSSNSTEAYIQDSSGGFATIKIRANLISALKYLRLTHQTRTLWVDALCINQKDILERNSQVPRMDKVYKFATSVIVWLGEAANGSDQAILTVEHLSHQIEITRQNTIGEAPEAEEPHWWNPVIPLPYKDETWDSLAAILIRPWFDRLWVVQEAQLGGIRTKVQCGRSSVAWTAFVKMIAILSSKTALSREVPGLCKVLLSVKPAVTEVGDATDFPRLLTAICHRQCLDPRDKIYGILGILSNTISNQIKPDYRSSVAEVYKYAMLTDVNINKRIQMLQSCDIEARIPEGPSWVPNWAGLDGRQQLSTYFGGIGRILVDNSGSTLANYVQPNVLEVVGRQWAQVLNVSTPASGTVEGQVRAFSEIAPACLEDNEHIAGGSLLDVLITIVSLGRVKERFPHSILYPSMAELRMRYQAEKHSSHQKLDLQVQSNGCLDDLTFFSTKEGYIGATLSKAQSGK